MALSNSLVAVAVAGSARFLRDSAKSAVGHGAAERFVLGGTEKTQHLPQSNGGDGKILEVWGRWKFNSKNNSLYFIFLFVE